MLTDYLPQRVNHGPWVSAYTLNHLQARTNAEFVLPICSLATPYPRCAEVGQFVLPPLFREALDETALARVVQRIRRCFPLYSDDSENRACTLRVVELPAEPLEPLQPSTLIALSIDTAVEQHGPHLPLGTDTIQSYSVLSELSRRFPQIEIGRPLEYGQLTWGLPFGFSIDLTAEILRDYVTRYVDALMRWKRPEALYVVDVHGSIVHRRAIVEGLQASSCRRWTFRWLHDPISEFSVDRGDQHAGGVETALVDRVGSRLIDSAWWPGRVDEIADGQITLQQAVEWSSDLEAFARRVREQSLCGVVGDVRNFFRLDADELFSRMIGAADQDVRRLLEGDVVQQPGQELW